MNGCVNLLEKKHAFVSMKLWELDGSRKENESLCAAALLLSVRLACPLLIPSRMNS
ncbi:unnamed protein product [Anisakis simplex]|uniref:Uncharacterized protein n=1 Tax=Anisakis simplex TaxID=6269 RepID=A0A0M3J7Q8_ANISI|nr:unnamed protein product [Anisakis simplex]